MTLRRAVFAGLALLVAAAGRAQLAPSSPFLPPASAVAAAPTQNAPLEFRGYMQTSDGTAFAVFDTVRKTSTWVKLNERDTALNFVAKQHDAEHDTLTIEQDGRSMTLPLHTAKVISSGSPQMMMPPSMQPPISNVPAAVTQAVVLNPTPAEEQRRLDAVAAEVTRRRALREQAAQQMAPPPGTPQALPQVQMQQQQIQPQVQQGFPPVGANSGSTRRPNPANTQPQGR